MFSKIEGEIHSFRWESAQLTTFKFPVILFFPLKTNKAVWFESCQCKICFIHFYTTDKVKYDQQ